MVREGLEKIFWISWKKNNVFKYEGGLGIRVMEMFNLVLLVK